VHACARALARMLFARKQARVHQSTFYSQTSPNARAHTPARTTGHDMRASGYARHAHVRVRMQAGTHQVGGLAGRQTQANKQHAHLCHAFTHAHLRTHRASRISQNVPAVADRRECAHQRMLALDSRVGRPWCVRVCAPRSDARSQA